MKKFLKITFIVIIVGFAGLLTLGAITSSQQKEAAEQGGFDSVAEYKKAKTENISTKEEYEAFLKRQAKAAQDGGFLSVDEYKKALAVSIPTKDLYDKYLVQKAELKLAEEKRQAELKLAEEKRQAEEAIKANIKLKEKADLDNDSISKCNDSCKGKSVFAELVEPRISSTRFDGDSELSKTIKANGIELKPINAEINDDGISIDLGFKEVNLNENELKSATFEISGVFVEDHFANDDVKGRIVSVSINKERLNLLIAEQKAEIERRQKREKLDALLDSLSDGEHKYYGANNRDNTISVLEAEALCPKVYSVASQAFIMDTRGASPAIRHIAANGGSEKKKIFWAKDLKRCLVSYNVSGLYNGTNYSEDRIARAVVFVKKASSYSIKYIQ